jgi:hypothetical protein
LTNALKFVDELILTIFKEAEFQSTVDITLFPKRYIHKILFKLTTENKDDKILFDSVPFYWYNHGPFSEIVAKSLDYLVELQILEIDKNSKFYILKKNNNNLNQIGDYEDFIHSLIKNFSVFESEKLVMDVYYKDSPYDFIPTYKKEFLEPIEKKLNVITNEKDFQEIISLSNLMDTCYDCEEKLPFEPIYRGFNEQFSIFSSILDKLYEEIDFNRFIITFKAIDDFWYTFAQALRVTKHHDFYNNKLDNWKGLYYNKLKDSKSTIKNLKDLERNIRHSKELKFFNSSSEILLSTVGKYISE